MTRLATPTGENWFQNHLDTGERVRERAHASGAGLTGPRERECKGVRGAQPLGVIRQTGDW
jgi:hypothetical protein